MLKTFKILANTAENCWSSDDLDENILPMYFREAICHTIRTAVIN